MKKLITVLFILAYLLSGCTTNPMNEFRKREAYLQENAPLREYTFIQNGLEKTVCGYYMLSPMFDDVYVMWKDGSSIARFSDGPTTAYINHDCCKLYKCPMEQK